LRILANSIPEHERILVIEDTPELHIRKPNIVAAQSQVDTFKNAITFHELLKDLSASDPTGSFSAKCVESRRERCSIP